MTDDEMLDAVCQSLEFCDYDRSTNKAETEAIEAQANWVRSLLAQRNELQKKLDDWEWLREHHNDIDAPILVCYSEKYETLEAAIDAAREAE